jgi:hypothetical protein
MLKSILTVIAITGALIAAAPATAAQRHPLGKAEARATVLQDLGSVEATVLGALGDDATLAVRMGLTGQAWRVSARHVLIRADVYLNDGQASEYRRIGLLVRERCDGTKRVRLVVL